MLIRWLFAALHLLGLGIALGSVWARARALGGPLDRAGLQRVFYADSWWGVSAAIWSAPGWCGCWPDWRRAWTTISRTMCSGARWPCCSGFSPWRWRRWCRWCDGGSRWRAGRRPTPSRGSLRPHQLLQALLLLLMMLAATAMARGIGVVPRS